MKALQIICGFLGGLCILLALAYIAGPDEEPGAEKARMQAAIKDLGKCMELERKLPAGYRLECTIKE
jgi:hypothetical protein